MKTWIIATILLLQTSFAGAAEFDFLPAKTPEQKDVKRMIEQQQFHQAFVFYPNAYAESDIYDTYTGVSLYLYLMFKAGVEVSALEGLFSLKEPQKMSNEMKALWKQNVPASHPVWNRFISPWNSKLTVIFDIQVSEKLAIYTFANQPKSLKQLTAWEKSLPKNSKKDIAQDTLKRWNIALLAPTFDKPEMGLKQLKMLSTSGQKMIATDRLALTEGRTLYQMKKLDAALSAYSRIEKSSEYWLEALEEKAWTFLRKGQPEKALAELQTVTSPLFAKLIGPEPYILMSLTHLDICDYTNVFKTSQIFKNKFKERIAALTALANGKNDALIGKTINALSKAYELKTIAKDLNSLPRFLFLDAKLQTQIKYQEQAKREVEVLSDLLTEQKVNAEDPFEKGPAVFSELKEKSAQARDWTGRRIRALAQSELDEIKDMILKLHLIEAEVIQRVSIEERTAKRNSERDSHVDAKDVLKFPHTDEVWLDEIGNYSVRIKDCPKLKEAAL